VRAVPLVQELSQEILVETVIAVIQTLVAIQIIQMVQSQVPVVAPRVVAVELALQVLDLIGQLIVQPITLL
jgi:hypothetical protein